MTGRLVALLTLAFALTVGAAPTLHAQVTEAEVFVEATVDNTTPFVGQQIVYSFRFFTSVLLSTSPGYEPPDFEGFWRASVGPATQYTETINGKQYIVTQLDTSLYPTRVGEISIDPSLLTLSGNVFNEEQQLLTDEIVVQAQPLPEGAPEGFGGAVGQFTMAATIDRQSVTQGEPITLRLTVAGTGDVEQLPSPELPVPEAWRTYENQTTYEAFEQDDIVVGEKVFEWQIIPDQPGQHTLPPVTLSFFDPNELVYQSVSTSEVVLDILPPSEDVPQNPEIVAEVEADPALEVLTIKPVPARLSFSDGYPNILFWGLWTLPPLLVVASWAFMFWQAQQAKNSVANRRSKALQKARRRLQSTSRMQPKEAYQTIAQAILEYFSDKLNKPTKSYSQTDLQRVMYEKGAGTRISEQVLFCVEWAEAGRFAPVNVSDAATLAERTIKALTALDRVWKPDDEETPVEKEA